MQGFVLWMTGLPGSGRTGLAECVEENLLERGLDVELLTQDMLKDDFGEELGDDEAGRDTLVHRAAVIANMLSRNGVPVIVAMDAPSKANRDEVRDMAEQFVQVYCKSDSAPDAGYTLEEPEKPEILIENESTEDGCRKILHTLSLLNYLADGGDSEYSDDEEAEIKKRLKDLGYL